MHYEIKEFMENHIDLIDANNFVDLYMAATTKWTFPNNRNTSLMTEYLLEAGINPLEYMDWIPLCMFWESNIKHIDIPETITFIENDAFYGSDIEEITIPASCNHIGPNAFSACGKLTKMTILNPYCNFDEETLCGIGISNIRHITYNGTVKEFRERYKDVKLPKRFILQANDFTTMIQV